MTPNLVRRIAATFAFVAAAAALAAQGPDLSKAPITAIKI
jgi:hypothetical protein